jgi:hypothetical protein
MLPHELQSERLCRRACCNVKREMNELKEDSHGERLVEVLTAPARRSWLVGVTSLIFILLQSACTAVMAISGVRVVIGLSALAAAAGLHRPARGFHEDAIRIPMMVVAVAGSLVNLYVIWRIRSLRARPASQWRVRPVTARQRRAEVWQMGLAILTLVLVALEYATHLIVHGA